MALVPVLYSHCALRADKKEDEDVEDVEEEEDEDDLGQTSRVKHDSISVYV